MKSKEEIRDWILDNCVDKCGNIDLSYLDFSDFDGDIYISDMKVKRDLYQNYQKVVGSIHQENHYVRDDLFQGSQAVGKELHSHRISGVEKWENFGDDVKRVSYIETEQTGSETYGKILRENRKLEEIRQESVNNFLEICNIPIS